MAEEEKEAPAPAPTPAKKAGALLENKVILLGIIVIAQALTALAVTQFFIAPRLKATTALTQASLGGAKLAGDDHAAKEGVLAGLDEMIITLRGEGGATHYLRTNVSLEVTDVKVSKLIEDRKPQLRDTAIQVLSSRTVDDLLTPEGKAAAKKEMQERIGALLPAGALLNVYFADLMIQ
jgi:flagellar basal body-associated protein FliL